MYLESSKDILFLVLAFCVLWFTAFACWALWYVITMLRAASKVVGDVRDKLKAIDEAIRGVREKVEHSANYLGILASSLKIIMSYFEDRKEEMKKKAKKIIDEELE
jgi:hypothetical protein